MSDKIHVWLVEDDIDSAQLVREAISMSGVPFNVTHLQDGVEVMELLNRKKKSKADLPELILLDLNLPQKSGAEVLAEMKADPLLKHIPVYLLTTTSYHDDLIQKFKLHPSCCYTKPDRFLGYVDLMVRIYQLSNQPTPTN